MHQRGVWLIAGILAVPSFVCAGSLTQLQVVEMYAADASASLVLPAPLPGEPLADINLARQVNDAISGIVASGAAQVWVVAREGHITLQGLVASDPIAEQLMDTVSAVSGVKEVTSELKLIAS